ncbi:MAG: histidine triad nucleotide-binding protein [Nevskiaceae bacterium]|nr:MAG: histidine triad nucleotide-binding protein [Nevskiaceae bacterium]TBR73318.1 MAG: histidine triad nucleotide-binding protein [Nevskiaceae bacterium]
MVPPENTPGKTPAKTLFQRIIDRELPGKFVHEDNQCVAIEDINPGAPLHLLVIPRKPLPRLVDATAEDQALLGHLLLVANRLAVEKGYGDAYRVVINSGADAGQSVFHLHVHVLAGRPFRWPPG